MKRAVLLALLPLAAIAAEVDTATGLLKRPGWEQVRANCAGCHSFRVITSQRGDRQTWLDIIRWMQASENLPALPADMEARILGLSGGRLSVAAHRRAASPHPERIDAPRILY